MACRHNDTRIAPQIAHRIGKRGGGHQEGIQENLKSLSRINCRRGLGKQRRIVAAIVSDCHSAALFVAVCQQIVRNARRSTRHGVNIHAVGSRAQHAAKTCRSEIQLAIKAIKYFLFVIIRNPIAIISCRDGQILTNLINRHRNDTIWIRILHRIIKKNR